jgi:hypothetical protein
LLIQCFAERISQLAYSVLSNIVPRIALKTNVSIGHLAVPIILCRLKTVDPVEGVPGVAAKAISITRVKLFAKGADSCAYPLLVEKVPFCAHCACVISHELRAIGVNHRGFAPPQNGVESIPGETGQAGSIQRI